MAQCTVAGLPDLTARSRRNFELHHHAAHRGGKKRGSNRSTHRCHILETGNDSYRFKASSETAQKKRKEATALTPS
jgi:hypothetical protein